MIRSAILRNMPVEYFLLGNPSAVGPVVGYLAGRPIPETVVDDSGHRYRYAGVAPRRRDGGVDVASLQEGEWLVEPDLVYALDGGATG